MKTLAATVHKNSKLSKKTQLLQKNFLRRSCVFVRFVAQFLQQNFHNAPTKN